MLSKPSVAKNWVVVNPNRTSIQAATSGGREIVAILLSGGTGGAAVRVYDSAQGEGEPAPSINAILVTANAGESSSFCPAQPILFRRGLYVELEQGVAGNAEATVVYN